MVNNYMLSIETYIIIIRMLQKAGDIFRKNNLKYCYLKKENTSSYLPNIYK